MPGVVLSAFIREVSQPLISSVYVLLGVLRLPKNLIMGWRCCCRRARTTLIVLVNVCVYVLEAKIDAEKRSREGQIVVGE